MLDQVLAESKEALKVNSTFEDSDSDRGEDGIPRSLRNASYSKEVEAMVAEQISSKAKNLNRKRLLEEEEEDCGSLTDLLDWTVRSVPR
jgi:hypothetical protein